MHLRRLIVLIINARNIIDPIRSCTVRISIIGLMFLSDASLHRFDRSDQKNQNSRTITVPPRGCRVKQTVLYLFTMSKYPAMDALRLQHDQTLLLSLTRMYLAEIRRQSLSKPTPNEVWWSQTGSNRRHPACKAGALPAELWPHHGCHQLKDMVGPGRLELPTSRLSGVRSNHLSYGPETRHNLD